MTSPTGAVGRQRDAPPAAVAVLGDRLVGVQVQRHHERARAVGRRQREGLPPARGEPQRRVLELRLGRRDRRRELAQDLGVRVQRVAGRAPTRRTTGRASSSSETVAARRARSAARAAGSPDRVERQLVEQGLGGERGEDRRAAARGSCAAARQTNGARNSQIRSVSALVKPRTAAIAITAKIATAVVSPRVRARSASQLSGTPRTTRNATGEPRSQNQYGRVEAMPAR